MLRLVAFVLSLQLAAVTAESAAETPGAAGRALHGTLPVGIRIAAAGEPFSTNQKFEISLNAALRSSTRPRDWALAASATPDPSRTIGAATAHFDGDLFRAAQAAPSDTLVQWLAANYGDTSTPENASRRAAAIDALTRLEPDNGAAWMQALAAAAERSDDTAVDDALARMAEGPRFDDHFVDVVHAWIDVYDRHVPPASLSTDAYDAGFVAAFAKAAATALPAYQRVVLACKPSATQPVEFQRAAPCRALGRTMLQRGDTLIARSIGFAVLRNLDAATDAARAAKRDLDWYHANLSRGTGEDGEAHDALAHESDWRRMDDEIEIVKSSLHRAGLPTAAPDGWAPRPQAQSMTSG
jgi:hypothetical protein